MKKRRTTEQILTRMVDQLRKENEALKATVVEIREDAMHAVNDYNRLKDEKKRLIWENAALTVEVTDLNKKVQGLEERVEELQKNQVTPELQTWIEGLEQSVHELTMDKVELKDQNKQLETSLEYFIEDSNKGKQAWCDLWDEKKAIEDKAKRLADHNRRLIDEVQRLKQQRDVLRNMPQQFCPEDLNDRLVGLIKIAHPDKWQNHELATEITKHLNDWRKELKKVA